MLRPCRNLQLPAFPDQQFCQCPTPVPQESQSCPIWPRHDLDRPPPPSSRAEPLVSFILYVSWTRGFLPSAQKPEASWARLWVGARREAGWLTQDPLRQL